MFILLAAGNLLVGSLGRGIFRPALQMLSVAGNMLEGRLPEQAALVSARVVLLRTTIRNNNVTYPRT